MTASESIAPTRNPPASLVRFLALALLLAGAAALAGCRTTSGLGDDIKHLGGNIEDSADRNTP